MKIAVRGGHNFSVPGARGIIDETTEDRKVKDCVINLLNSNGVSVLDCTAPDSYNTQSSDLVYGVDKANNWGADYFVSIHFNNAYNSYNGAIGTETVVHSQFDMAQRITNNLVSLGFKNRGQKLDTRGLYELRHTNMKAVIVEVCFVEATEDVAIYRKVGPEGCARAIVSAILNKQISSSSTTSNQNIEEDDELMDVKNVFCEKWYLQNYADVAAAVKKGDLSASEHYVKYGKKEGRKPNCGIPKGWNEAYYLINNPDVDSNVSSGNGFVSGLHHYLAVGWNEPQRANTYLNPPTVQNNDSDEGKETYYRVVAGSYKDRDNAQKQLDLLNEKGIEGGFISAFKK